MLRIDRTRVADTELLALARLYHDGFVAAILSMELPEPEYTNSITVDVTTIDDSGGLALRAGPLHRNISQDMIDQSVDVDDMISVYSERDAINYKAYYEDQRKRA